MKFDDLDLKMRVYETANDVCVLPEMYIVARIDGRSFTRLTKEIHKFEAPFDERMREMMRNNLEQWSIRRGRPQRRDPAFGSRDR